MAGLPFVMTVEAGKVREFARAVRARDAVDPEVSAPTFLMTACQWRDLEHEVVDFAGGFERSLHAGEEFVFHCPPPGPGAELVGVSRLGDVVRKDGRRGGSLVFTEIVTEFRDRDGVLVVENRSTLVEVEKPPS